MSHKPPNQSIFSYYASFSLHRSLRVRMLSCILHKTIRNFYIYPHTSRRHFSMRAIFTTFSMIAALLPLNWLINSHSINLEEMMPSGNQAVAAVSHSNPPPAWLTTSVQKGDDLSAIFNRHQLNQQDLSALLHIKPLNKLRPTQALRIKQEHGNIQELYLAIDFTKELHVFKQDNQFTSKIFQRDIQTDTVTVHGKVGDSLFTSSYAAGLSEQLISKFLAIFHWDIDFHPLDTNDTFTVVYQRYYHAGRTQAGDILAAEIVNQGKIYRAVRYVDPKGNADYYKPNGMPLFSTIVPALSDRFPIAPLKILNISSRFGMRNHPVYHKKRFHSGVDYVANYGTPIFAVANATVKFVGWQSGYGNTVILQHDEHRDTVYAHISKFAEIKPEQDIKQGDVIGYVGKTGVTTGAHLHYEFRYDDEPRNPKEFALPLNPPLQHALGEGMNNFFKNTQTVVTQLDHATGIVWKDTLPEMTTLAKAAGAVNLVTRD